MIWQNLVFAYPNLLYLLLILIPIIAWYVFKQRTAQATLTISTTATFKAVRPSWRVRLRHLPFVLRLMVLTLLIIVLARPQLLNQGKNISSEGIDIMITFDISASMLAKDFEPNRLDAAKEVAAKFIADRAFDRIGLVLFSGAAFSQCPLTTDHAMLVNLLGEAEVGMIEQGTAIGEGVGIAVSRLKDSQAQSRVIICLTDGVNNRGKITPHDAALLAKELGIRVYTIGVGSEGSALTPVALFPDGSYQYDYRKVEIDEAGLQEIAKLTGGQYFRATNQKVLEKIYEQIDELEKSKIEITQYRSWDDKYWWFAVVAACLLGLEVLLRHSLLRTIP